MLGKIIFSVIADLLQQQAYTDRLPTTNSV